MSGESEPNNEIEKRVENPLRFKCGGCGKKDATTYENTLYIVYEHDQLKNHVRTACDRQDFFNIKFIDFKDEEQVQWAEQFIMLPENYCEDESIEEMWKHTFKVGDAPDQYETTGSQEKKIAFLAHELGRLSSDEIISELQQPQPPRTLPERWI